MFLMFIPLKLDKSIVSSMPQDDIPAHTRLTLHATEVQCQHLRSACSLMLMLDRCLREWPCFLRLHEEPWFKKTEVQWHFLIPGFSMLPWDREILVISPVSWGEAVLYMGQDLYERIDRKISSLYCFIVEQNNPFQKASQFVIFKCL